MQANTFQGLLLTPSEDHTTLIWTPWKADTVMPLCLQIAHACFYTKVAELGRHSRNRMPCKPQNSDVLVLDGECPPTPTVGCGMFGIRILWAVFTLSLVLVRTLLDGCLSFLPDAQAG